MKLLKIAILSLFVILAGCVEPGDNPLTEDELRKGTDSVEISFTDDAPPEAVLEESPFKIGAELRNRGAYQADVHLTLSVEDDYLELDKYKKTISVRGKSLSTPDGGREKVYFNAKSKQVGAQKTKHPTNIILTACYNYKTIFADQVCINPHQYNKGEEDVCTETIKDFNSQGAPVAVTKVETRMENEEGKVRPIIIIHVENKGDGTLLKGNAVERACGDSSLEREDMNVVKLSEFYLGNIKFPGENIDCDAKTKLIDDKGKFTCKLEEKIDTNSPAYNAQARAVLMYGYTKSVSKNVDVERRI